jgi:hypothetical protein
VIDPARPIDRGEQGGDNTLEHWHGDPSIGGCVLSGAMNTSSMPRARPTERPRRYRQTRTSMPLYPEEASCQRLPEEP